MSYMKRLMELRKALEDDGATIADVEVPAAVLLSDVCEVLGLSPKQRRVVLGTAGVQYVDGLLDGTVALNSDARQC